MKDFVQIRDLDVSLDKKLVLSKVNMDLPRGELIGLIGPNGAGKSTLMRTLLRFLPFQKGRIEVKGQSLSEIHRRRLAQYFSYLPQGASVSWSLTAQRVVALGRIPHLLPWQDLRKIDYEAIYNAMKKSDVLHLADRPMDHLAGGEKALVMFARVLAGNSEMILADEPVAGLDPNHQIQVMQLLKDVAFRGSGVMVVLHDLTLAARFCDRLYLLREGKILASGSAADVLSPDNLKEGYGINARYGHFDQEFYVIPWKRL
ncbi:MAG: ABC transporter ATP-binding protein [Candidatus Omnitrophica bacterium]|nr:ABC transporter ATP-binding protein [Candidatus Omnitrophota bacterium]